VWDFSPYLLKMLVLADIFSVTTARTVRQCFLGSLGKDEAQTSLTQQNGPYLPVYELGISSAAPRECFGSSVLSSDCPVVLRWRCAMFTAYHKTKQGRKFIITWTVTFLRQGKSFLYLGVLIKWFPDFSASGKHPNTPGYFQEHFGILYSGYAEIPLIEKEASYVYVLNCADAGVFWFMVACVPDRALGALHNGQKRWRICRLMWPFIQSRKDRIGTQEICIERESLHKFSGPLLSHLKDRKATEANVLVFF